jgi:hypothetical protein
MSDHRSSAVRVVVPRPDRVRNLDRVAFGWLDARLRHDGWFGAMTPQTLAVYAFLCVVADRHGVSFYRRERIARELGLDAAETTASLARLCELDLVAYAPFRPRAVDGFHQVLSLPAGGPPATLAGLVSLDRLVEARRA